MKKNYLLSLMMVMMMAACSTNEKKSDPVSAIAESYVKMVLHVGLYNSDFVDAYYGPSEWKPQPIQLDSNTFFPYQSFAEEISSLKKGLAEIDTTGMTVPEKQRILLLNKQMIAVEAKIEMINRKKFTFDEEAGLLYDANPPVFTEEHFRSLLSQLDKALPGKGAVAQRYNDFKNQFIIPKDKLDDVFQTAIMEAKKRTRMFITLPDTENFILEYVTGKSWSGYNYYKGGFKSLIQINTDLPIFIDRAVDLACHEGYPGHHVFNVLLEKSLVIEKGWIEFTVYPLFSPQSLIAEGSANYGIDVAFPGNQRIEFERDVLFPIAGLKKEMAEQYYDVLGLTKELSYAGNEAARGYLNGTLTKEDAVRWLVDYSLMSPERAEQRIKFIEQYRSYVINYNYGQDLVKDYIERNGGTPDQPQTRWNLFSDLLSNPKLPSQLK